MNRGGPCLCEQQALLSAHPGQPSVVQVIWEGKGLAVAKLAHFPLLHTGQARGRMVRPPAAVDRWSWPPRLTCRLRCGAYWHSTTACSATRGWMSDVPITKTKHPHSVRHQCARPYCTRHAAHHSAPGATPCFFITASNWSRVTPWYASISAAERVTPSCLTLNLWFRQVSGISAASCGCALRTLPWPKRCWTA